MPRKIILLLILLLIVPEVFSDIKITTIATTDIYGETKIEHTFNEPIENIDLNVYSPESLDSGDVKFTISNNTMHLKDVKKDTHIIYLSDTIAKKEGDWIIKYSSLNQESFKLLLPFSAKIKEITGNHVQSKDRTGQVIEWDPAENVGATYTLTSSNTNNLYKPLSFALLLALIGLLIYVIRKKTEPEASNSFIDRLKGIKRQMVRQVIYAILILTYERNDKLIDQSKIRWILTKEGFKDINSHKSEIHTIVHKELNWLINLDESKITIKSETEKEYNLLKNAKKTIKDMKELIGEHKQ